MKLPFVHGKGLFFAVILGCWGLSLPAQTAAKIESLLETPAVSYAQAAYFVLEAADTAVTAYPEEAFDYVVKQKWLPKKVSPNDAARLDRVSLLLMRSFGLKGGLFYTIAKNPHYAYREMVYCGVIQGKTDPHAAVSGEQLLFITGRILSIFGEK
ncbi:MAG: hypothetical protein LBG95_02215 [Treponema sp.]|nr:hypothetical protein [Treponema sp.]